MKKLLILLFLPIILFAQRPEGFRGTNGISMVDIRIAIGDSNIVSLQGTTPDTAKIQGGYPLKLSGLRVTGNAKFESNVVMSTIAGEQIKAGAGTVALPQYSASADTNTGLYLDGADGLGLSTAGAQRLFINSAGKIGKGTATPLTSFSLVDATSGQGTGIHVVSSQWNKSRTIWAAAHDTSSIMQYIDSAGGPRLSMKAVNGDSLGVNVIANNTYFGSSGVLRLFGASGIGFGTTATSAHILTATEFYPVTTDQSKIGKSGYGFKEYWGTDNIYLGGKSQTATLYISGENTIAGQDSALVLSALNGVPTISAMHTGTFTNGGRRFYTGADTLLLVNGAKTGRDSTFWVMPTGGHRTTGMYGNNSEQAVTVTASATTFAVLKNNVAVTGDAGGNTIATITGGGAIGLYTFRFIDDKITITDTDAGTSNTVNLSAAFTSTANDIMTLYWNGTSWYEASRSVN